MILNKVYSPGEKICIQGDKISARGTYVQGGQIIAAIVGRLTLNQNKVELVNFLDAEQPELKVGTLITCRVLRIKEDRAIVRIIKIDGKTSQSAIEGVIRRQNARQYEVDKLKMDECFLPGDIVLAQLLSYGDSHTLYLSTADDKLGVIFAKSQESGELMLPISWEEMICVKTGIKEKRIVAKPDLSQFQVKQ